MIFPFSFKSVLLLLISHRILVRSNYPNNYQEYKEVLQILIDRGAIVNAVDKDSHTALDAAFEVNESEGKFQNQLIISKMECLKKKFVLNG